MSVVRMTLWLGFQTLPEPVAHRTRGEPFAVVGVSEDKEQGCHIIWTTDDAEGTKPAWTRILLMAGFKDRAVADQLIQPDTFALPDPKTYFARMDELADVTKLMRIFVQENGKPQLRPFSAVPLAEIVTALRESAATLMD